MKSTLIFLLPFYLFLGCGPDEGSMERSYLKRLNHFVDRNNLKIQSLQDAVEPKKMELPKTASSSETNPIIIETQNPDTQTVTSSGIAKDQPQAMARPEALVSQPIAEVPIASNPLVPNQDIFEGSNAEVLPQVNTLSNQNVVHRRVINHYQDIHRYQNKHHHHNTNHIYETKHRYFTRIINHPSVSFSESVSTQAAEFGEAYLPSQTTLPIGVLGY